MADQDGRGGGMTENTEDCHHEMPSRNGKHSGHTRGRKRKTFQPQT